MKVTIVGGGVIGLSIAWRAAERGLDVVVIDPAPGRASSWAAAGMLAPVTEVHYGEEGLLDINLASAALWPGFAADLEAFSDQEIGYLRTGTLVVARDTDDMAVLNALFEFQQSLDLPVERLGSREIRFMEPALSVGIRSGLFVSGDHQVDNRLFISALLVACKRSGVAFDRRRVKRIDGNLVTVAGDSSDVENAHTNGASAGAEICAEICVLAAGAWSAQIEGIPDAARPAVRPIKGQILRLRSNAKNFLSRSIRGIDAYIVPRASGEVVVGATSEDRGFDTMVTTGAVHELLRAAIELVPDVAELEFVEALAGLRPGSHDNVPMIGNSDVDGLVLATGHFRNGILLAPLTASAITSLLCGEELPAMTSVASPSRHAVASP